MTHWPLKPSLTGEQHLTGSKRGEDRLVLWLQLMHNNEETAPGKTYSVMHTISPLTFEEVGI